MVALAEGPMRLQRYFPRYSSQIDYYLDLDEAQTKHFLAKAASYNEKTKAEIITELEAGNVVKYDDIWYAKLRCGDAIGG
jgi:hypothetical protein